MKEKFNYISIEKAHNILNKFLKVKLEYEIISVDEAYNRVLAEKIQSHSNIPPFNVSHFDGYALRAKDTSKASITNPIFLKVISLEDTSLQGISSGETVYVSTGSKLVEGTDAVIPIEMVTLKNGLIRIIQPIRPYQNLTFSGQDFKKGETIYEEGQILRVQDVKLLMDFKKWKVKVLKKPVVAVVSTGSELTNKMEDSNMKKFNSLGPMISTLIYEEGGIPKNFGIVIDDLNVIKEKLRELLQNFDAIAIIGGSSVGKDDYVWEAINSLMPKIMIHGIKVQPGRVTSLGIIHSKAIVNLPGHVQSTLIGFYILMSPVIKQMLGLPFTISYPTITAVMSEKLVVKAYAPFERIRFVRISEESGKYSIKPVIGDSSLNKVLITTNGFIKIPRNRTIIEKGEEIQVHFLPGVFPYNLAN